MRGFVAGLLLLLLAACNSPVSPTASERRELVVAIRETPPTYSLDADQQATGFEYDLLAEFARELERPIKLEVLQNEADIYRYLEAGKADVAIGWLSPPASPGRRVRGTKPYAKSRAVLAQHEADLPIDSLDDLAGETLHVATGSGLAERLLDLRKRVPTLGIVERPDQRGLGLLQDLAEQKIDLLAIDQPIFDIAQNYFPELQSALPLGEPRPISWLFPINGPDELFAKAEDFLARAEREGTLAKLRDRYFGHVRRLDPPAIVEFLERVRQTLPKYQNLFKQGQVRSGIDWRLLAALAYQESQWDPLATSPTNVRGMMMLTEETADQMNVGDRLNAKESILAGADYLADLREQLPATVKEPDRTWLALAAYNLGMGHLNGGRAIAPSVKVNPDLWYEMKRVLPLMARPEYYRRLKSGRARGGEAVIMVENVRAFYDILKRLQPAYDPLARSKPEVLDTGKTPAKPLPKKLSPIRAEFRQLTDGQNSTLPRLSARAR